MKHYACPACSYVYDPDEGDLDALVAMGTPFEDLPDDWECPECGAAKDLFEPVESQG